MINITPPRVVGTTALGLAAVIGSIVLLTLSNNGTIPQSPWYIVPGVIVVAYWLLARLITDSVRHGMVLASFDMAQMEDDFEGDEDGDGDAPRTLNAETFAQAMVGGQ